MNESELLQALATVTPEDMAKANVGAKLFWAALDVAVAATIYVVICKVPFVAKWIFEYDTHLDNQAELLDSGEIEDPWERGCVTQALADVKSKKILGLMLVMAAALIE